MLDQEAVAKEIEHYIQGSLSIDRKTDGLSRTCDLFEEGFVDSMGLMKLITFLENSFGVFISEEHLFDERFLTIDGQSRLVCDLKNSLT